GEEVLRVDSLSARVGYPDGISFSLRRGEILGIAGLVGDRRSKAVRTIFGLEPADDGSMRIRGKPALKAAYLTPGRALQEGIDLLSENRKDEGLALGLPLTANLTLSDLKRYTRRGLLNLRRERSDARKWIQALGIRTRDEEQPAVELSGGNQQKVCLARQIGRASCRDRVRDRCVRRA